MSITAGLAATKAALDITKIILDKVNTPKIDGDAVRASVQEMLIHVVNAQVALGEAHVEICELRQKLDDREAFKELVADMEFVQDGSFYLRRSESKNGIFNPCCPVCWADSQKAIPLRPGANGFYVCVIHKSSYQTNAAKEGQRRIMEQQAQRRESGPAPRSWMAR